ncbi:unnamed protein product [Vicia faba]|uniref:RNase H type-1 domain-containing protein n=1 Tax=Vicia faba TaxID=3906 RepID=A0AAV1AZL8_VICFA|nr:unnamed protein product [Vicia faba]
MDWLNCNVDASFNNNNGTTNSEWCVCNHSGNFISPGFAWDPRILPVIEVEASTLKDAILRAMTSHLEFVTFESDSQRVIQAIHYNRNGDSEFSLIIESISTLFVNFPSFEGNFIKCQSNMVAHSIASAINSWARRS